MSRDPEFLTVLRPRRDPQHHPLTVERFHFDARAQQRLREIDRHDADDVESFAAKETVGGDMDHDHEIAPTLGPLILEPEARSVLDAGRNVDVDTLFDADFAAALTRGTALRRHSAFPAAHRARTIDGKTALSERDRAAPIAFRTGVDCGALGRTGAAAGRTNLRHRQRNRH